MSKTIVLWLVAGCWLAALPCIAVVQNDQLQLITLGRHKAHPTRILARYTEQADPAQRAQLLQDLGLKERRQYALVPGLVLLDDNGGDQDALNEITHNDRVEQLQRRIKTLGDSGLFQYAEPDYAVYPSLEPTDERFTDGTLWGLHNTGQNGGAPGADIDAVRAWDISTGATNVIVAVIDTGIYYPHRELIQQMWKNPGEVGGNGADDDGDGYIDNVFGINAITDSSDPLDDDDHGTHVAGTIGAAANDGNPHVGVTWNVRLMACKFIRAGQSGGFGIVSDAIQCIDFAVNKGARILNNSWGGGGFEISLEDAIKRARAKGVLFVAAAGNNGEDNDANPHYPSSYQVDNIIAVAAIDRLDRLAVFSNYGTNSVHVGAPGVSIFSSTSSSDTDYQVFAGTSMAAPHVSGIAALILGKYPRSTVQELKERIVVSVVPTPALKDKVITGGRVNAYNALLATPDGILEVTVDPTPRSSLLQGSTVPVYATVRDLFAITNATVRASVVNATNGVVANLSFLNDGRTPDVVTNDNVYTATLIVPTNTPSLTLTVIVTAPGKTPSTNRVEYAVVLPPPNDFFANAAKFPSPGGVVQGTNRFATTEFREPVHARVSTFSSSLWWNWSAPKNGPVIVDLAGSAFDTLLAVYTGSVVGGLTEIASVDDIGGKKQGYVAFNAVFGTTYRIGVAGRDTNGIGLVRLRIEPDGKPDNTAPVVTVVNPPSGIVVTNRLLFLTGTAYDPRPDASGVSQVFVKVNSALATSAEGTTNWTSSAFLQEGANIIDLHSVDHSANASVPVRMTVNYRPVDPPNDLYSNAAGLTDPTGEITADSAKAGKEFNEPFHGGNDGGKSLWWSFFAAADGVLTLSTTNSTFDTLLGVYTGSRVGSLTTVAVNDDAFPDSRFSQLSQSIKGNQTYYIAVDGFASASGMVHLKYEFRPATVFQLTVNSTSGGSVSPGSGRVEVTSKVVLTATPEDGFEFAGWSGSVNSLDNPLSVVVASDLSLTAGFVVRRPSDDFENGDFSKLGWTTSGHAPWRVQTGVVSGGRSAAASGAIGNKQQSILVLVASLRGGPASFDFKISSEANWDFLEFFLDGERLGAWSGEAGWRTFQFEAPAGVHTLMWKYSKDINVVGGADTAYLDNLMLPLGVAASKSATLAAVKNVRSATGSFSVQFNGTPFQSYIIQASRDLVDWKSISTNSVPAQGLLDFVDPEAGNYSQRFYRAIVR